MQYTKFTWNDLYSLLGVESEDLVSEVLFSCGIEIGFDLTGKLKLSPGLSVNIFVSLKQVIKYQTTMNKAVGTSLQPSFVELYLSCQTFF